MHNILMLISHIDKEKIHPESAMNCTRHMEAVGWILGYSMEHGNLMHYLCIQN